MMRILSTYNPFRIAPKAVRLAGTDQSGSVMIYVIVVILIFGFLGAGMISMFTTANMMSSGAPNYARNAEYLAEAGLRYAVSELRNKGYTKEVISTLNSTTYTVDDAGTFLVNVFGKWFQPTADYSFSSGTLSLNIPQWNTNLGTFPSSTITTDDFDIPVGAWVVNYEGYRDALIYSGNANDYIEEIQSVVYSSINIGLTDWFKAKTSDSICLAVKSTEPNQTDVSVLKVPEIVDDFFPKKFGSFYVTNTLGQQQLYNYEELTDQDDMDGLMELTGIRSAGIAATVTVNNGDLVVLSPHNHMIAARGTTSSSVSGGENFYAANYRQNIENPETTGSPVVDTIDDIETDIIISGMDTPAETDSGAVDVDSGTGEITLGGGVTSAYGAVFFGGDVTIGGASVCNGGKCVFEQGVRAFYVLDYNGTGDGFTFALINGTDNAVGATGGSGGSGELLGYAGDGGAIGTGLTPPKMALEFDTYVNSSPNDPDLGTSHRDVLQYVYWGDGQADLFDDNEHDTGGSGEKWSPYSTTTDVITPTVLNSDESALYANSNGYIYAINPDDGNSLWASPYYFWVEANSSAAPVVDGNGQILIGNDYSSGYVDSVKSDGTGWNWYTAVTGDVRSNPVIDSSGIVYFGTESGYFYAFNNNLSSGSAKWFYDIGGSDDIKGTPALSPDEATVYFASIDSQHLYALNTVDGSFKWSLNLLGPIYSSPVVADDGTVYIGSDGGGGVGYLFAVNPDGSQKWRYDFIPTNPHSDPTIGPDGTIYIGNDDHYLYAITDEGTSGTLKWRFLTGGDIDSKPLVHADGTIWFGSDDNRLYVVDSDGLQIDRFNLYDDVRAGPIQGSDGAVYVGSKNNKVFAYKPTCNPQNIETRLFSYDDLLAGEAIEDLGDIADSDNWLNSGPWAVRVEIERSETANSRGLYEYTLKSWFRQCQQAGCSDITATYFADTRIEYAAKDPHLSQTAELCAAEHGKFNTFLYGFTQATGSATQTAVISNLGVGFIRPSDFIITSDANWQ